MRTFIRIVLATALVTSVAASAAAATEQKPFAVRSTLRGRTVLPHRIHWYAYPSLPAAKITAVDFLIDGRVRWVEHHAPYDYGFNGNYLVTSWLSAGRHRFTVIAHASDGRRGQTTVTARVLPAQRPPAALAGTWKRTMTPAQTHGQPAGTWILKISKVGWWIKVPDGGPGANLIDVAYLQANVLESRGGIWTKPNPPNNPTEGNGWCDEPFQPVRYRWTTTGDTLTLSLAGAARCDGASVIWAGEWTRSTS